MPMKLGAVGRRSMTRPCECGLGLRPRRLFGLRMEPMDRAPCFFSGSLTLGGCGLLSTDSFADRFVAGNGKIQGGSKSRLLAVRAEGATRRYMHSQMLKGGSSPSC